MEDIDDGPMSGEELLVHVVLLGEEEAQAVEGLARLADGPPQAATHVSRYVPCRSHLLFDFY
jgi:hypothetical protein